MVVIGPSNPIVSIGPILAGPIRALVVARARAGIPVVAVSPIVGGVALKGPADRMLVSLGHELSARGVARIYRDLATTFVLDTRRRRARARHRGPRAADPRHRHDHGRRSRPGAARPEPCWRPWHDPDRGDHPGRNPGWCQVAARRIARCRGAAGPRRGLPGTDRAWPRWPSTGSPTSSSSAPTATSWPVRPSSARGPSDSGPAASTAGWRRPAPMSSRVAPRPSWSCRSISRSSRPRRSRRSSTPLIGRRPRRRPRPRPPRHRHERPRAPAARRHRLRVRAVEPRRAPGRRRGSRRDRGRARRPVDRRPRHPRRLRPRRIARERGRRCRLTGRADRSRSWPSTGSPRSASATTSAP